MFSCVQTLIFTSYKWYSCCFPKYSFAQYLFDFKWFSQNRVLPPPHSKICALDLVVMENDLLIYNLVAYFQDI